MNTGRINSETRLSAIIDQSPLAIQFFTRDGRVTKVNRAWQTLWNVSDDVVENYLLKEYNVLADPVLQSMGLIPHIKRAFAGEVVSIPPHYYDPAGAGNPGRARWVAAHLSPIRSETGEVVEISLVLNDVTTTIEVSETLGQKQEELQAIVDNSGAVILMKDLEGRILLANRQFEKVWKKDKSQILGKRSEDFVGPEQAKILRENDLRVIRGKLPISEEETVTDPEGDKTYISAKFPIFDRNGEVRGMCAISTDITKQKRIEEERRQLEVKERAAREGSRVKSEFLANMGHEIRTPINGIISMTKLLAESPLTEAQRTYTDLIAKSSTQLLGLINDVLDVSKIEAAKMELEMVPFAIDDLVHDTHEWFEALAESRGLEFRVRMDIDRDRYFLGDPGRIRQILNNLIGNAFKFTERGSVRLEVALRGTASDLTELSFSVKDTGVGMSKEVQRRIFQNFSQGESSIARKYGGTGLGLAICKKLTELMHGNIECMSEPGCGSEFRFTIKLRAISQEEFKSARGEIDFATSSLTKSQRQNVRVLVVEDVALNQEITLRMLNRAGYRAEAVGNGLEALTALQDIAYDVVLMDCQMPEMDGYSAARAIRKAGKGIPVIALTAHVSKEEKVRCLLAGMSDLLAKPIEETALIATVDRWASRLLQSRELAQATSQQDDVLDLTYIKRLEALDEDGKQGLVARLIQMYLSSLPKAIDDIHQAALHSSSPELEKKAHALKSSSSNLGAIRVVRMLQNLEDGCDSEEEALSLVGALEVELKQVRQELFKYLWSREAEPSADNQI